MSKCLFYIFAIFYFLKLTVEETETIYSIKDFRSNPLAIAQREDFFRINLSIPTNCRVVSYADFNNDKYVDMIAACRDDSGTESIEFYKYDYKSAEFTIDYLANTTSYTSEYQISNLIAVDINADNLMDMIITVQNIITNSTTTEIYLLDRVNNKFTLAYVIQNSGIFLGDFDGNNLIDVLFYDESVRKRRFVNFKNFTANVFEFSSLFPTDPNCDGNDIYNTFPLPTQHSSAFVDIDADCLNDLVIMSSRNGLSFIEIWRGRLVDNTMKFCLNKNSVYSKDKSLGHFTISDINRDGMLDIIFPIKGTSNILIAFNKIELKFKWADDYCLGAKSTGDFTFPVVFDQFSINPSNSSLISIISLSDNPNEEIFYDNFTSPIVKIGDINTDSYPDLLVALQDSQTKNTRTVVFLNVYNPSISNIKLSRSFEINSTYILPPNNTYYSSFFDLDENGQLDVIIVSKNGNNYDIMGYYNNYIYDAFFLKSVTLLTKNFFITHEIGANYRYIATNLDGSRRMDVSFQGIQTSDLYLNLPYAFLGIGRSNNYIENFVVISNTHVKGQDNYKIFTPIIPNSQLIISKELFLDANPPYMNWELDLIVKPTAKLFLLIITIAVFLVVILAIIIFLHIKEVQEDQEVENRNFMAWFK